MIDNNYYCCWNKRITRRRQHCFIYISLRSSRYLFIFVLVEASDWKPISNRQRAHNEQPLVIFIVRVTFTRAFRVPHPRVINCRDPVDRRFKVSRFVSSLVNTKRISSAASRKIVNPCVIRSACLHRLSPSAVHFFATIFHDRTRVKLHLSSLQFWFFPPTNEPSSCFSLGKREAETMITCSRICCSGLEISFNACSKRLFVS